MTACTASRCSRRPTRQTAATRPDDVLGDARDVYEEGALIFPCVRVQQDYGDIDDIIRMCRMRIRVPDKWWGDYLALVGAARIGERELRSSRGGRLGHARRVRGGLVRLQRAAHGRGDRALPDRQRDRHARHDPFPSVPDGIPSRTSRWSRAGRIEVDLRDNPDCQPCGLNLTEATARSAAMIGVFNSLHVPAGERRRVPATASAAARELRRRHPATPASARSRPGTSPTASRTPCSGRSRSSPTVRAGRDRAHSIPASRGPLRPRPATRR